METNKKEKMKYFILDYGVNTSWAAELVMQELKKDSNNHVITYLTDLDNSFMVTELSQDEFLDVIKYDVLDN